MDVALDAAPTGLFGLHDAGPRGRQLARLALDLGQTLRQLGGECRVPNGQRRLPAEGLEQLMVPGLERPLFLGATVDGPDAALLFRRRPILGLLVAAAAVGDLFGSMGGYVRLHTVSELAAQYLAAASDQQPAVLQIELRRSFAYARRVSGNRARSTSIIRRMSAPAAYP